METTDWNSYYDKPYQTAKISRKFTGNILVKLIRKYSQKKENFEITELGGANSCNYELLVKNFRPKKYIIIDNNQLGLNKFMERIGCNQSIVLINDDILKMDSVLQSDLTYSIGLIEHFCIEDTAKAIKSHFDITRPGGVVIISFPTPTLLYRITRKISEILGLWIFYDERPLKITEVTNIAKQYGEIKETTIIWPIFLTQGIIVVEKSE